MEHLSKDEKMQLSSAISSLHKEAWHKQTWLVYILKYLIVIQSFTEHISWEGLW